MRKCTSCGADTDLYVNDLPVCQDCRETQPSKRKVPTTEKELRDRLLQEVIEATARNNAASQEFNLVIGQTPSGLDSDGAQRIHNASRALTLARKQVMTAHARLNEYFSRGVVPEDLQGSRR